MKTVFPLILALFAAASVGETASPEAVSKARKVLQPTEVRFTEERTENACDERTDRYQAVFRIKVAGYAIGICKEIGEAEFSDSGESSSPKATNLFAFRESGENYSVFKPIRSDTPALFAAVGPQIEEAGQSSHKHWVWFQTASTTHLFESCDGGRLCAPYVRYIAIEGGRAVVDRYCQEAGACWEGSLPESEFIEEDYESEKPVISSKMPRYLEVRALPDSVLKIIEEKERVVEQPQDLRTVVPPARQQTVSSQQARSIAGNEPAACALIASNETVRAYIELTKQAQAMYSRPEDRDRAWAPFETADTLLGAWVEQQVSIRTSASSETVDTLLPAFLREQRLRTISYSELEQHREKYAEWTRTLKQCAYAAKGTDLLIFFEPRPELRKFLEDWNPAGMSPQPPRRTIDASGNVVMVAPTAPQIDWATVRGGPGEDDGSAAFFYRCHQGCSNRSDRLPESNYAAALAFVIPGGDKVIASLGEELIERAKRVRTVAARDQAEREQRANERQREEAGARQAAEAQARRFAEIRAGNWQSVTSCVDVAMAFLATNQINDGVAVMVTPTQALHAVGLPLRSFEGNDVLGSAIGDMSQGQLHVRFNANRSTRWFGRESLAINGQVTVVGKYVSNRTIRLTNGATTTGVVLEATCVSAGR